MKKIFFIGLVFLLTTTSLIGQQIRLINKSVSDKTSKTIYIGIENNIEIQGDSFRGILPLDGVILEGNTIKIRPTKVGQLTITFITNEGKTPINFNVRTVPEVFPIINGQANKEINKNTLHNQGLVKLKCLNNYDTYFDNYNVISYKATINGNNYEVYGNNFTNELLSAINNANSGDIIIFSNVKGFNEEINHSISLETNFSFKIK